MRVVSLFSGAGGMDLGFKQAGCKIIYALDSDPDACETYRRNIGPHIVCADAREVNGYDLPECDVIIGGPPCQPFSIAGKRLGEKDPRNMIPRFLYLVNQKSPRWVLMENVPGLSAGDGRQVQRVVTWLERIGYRVRVGKLNASDYGVPQKRIRLFVVAWRSSGSLPWPAPTHLGGLLGRGPVTVREALGLGEGWIRNDIATRGEGNSPEEPSVTVMVERPPVLINWKNKGRPASVDRPAPTVLASQATGTGLAWVRERVRRLTVEECAALQGFPPEFEFVGTKASQYRQIGNAVPPPVARAWARAILMASGQHGEVEAKEEDRWTKSDLSNTAGRQQISA